MKLAKTVTYDWDFRQCRRGIKPLKKGYIHRDVVGIDTETTEHGEFYSCQIYDMKRRTHKIFYDKKKAVSEILSKKYKRNTIFWGFNWKFDADVLFEFRTNPLKMEKMGYCVRDFEKGTTFFFTISRYRDYGRNRKKKQHDTWKFYDVSNFYKGSLDAVSEIHLNTRKLKAPSWLGERGWTNSAERKLFERYAMRDAYLTARLGEKIHEMHAKYDVPIKPTPAAFSMTVFRKNFQKKTIAFFRHNIMDMISAYHGGRTEAIGRGKFEKVNVYDISSSYPHAMSRGFPRFPLVEQNVKNIMDDSVDGIVKARVRVSAKNNLAPLPYKHKQKLIFPVGEYEGVFFTPELRAGIDYGLVELLEVKWFYGNKNIDYGHKEFVEKFYKLKKEAKNRIERDEYKLILNSLYGKYFSCNEKKIRASSLHIIKEAKKFGEAVSYETDIHGRHYLKTRKMIPSVTFNPVIAGLITSRARAEIFRAGLEYDVIYMDTDSVFTKKRIPTGSELGAFKLEERNNFVFVRSKLYFSSDFNKLGIHAVRLRPIEFSNHAGLMMLFGDNTDKMKYRYLHMVTPKEALIRGAKNSGWSKPRVFVLDERTVSFDPDQKRKYLNRLVGMSDLSGNSTMSVPLNVQNLERDAEKKNYQKGIELMERERQKAYKRFRKESDFFDPELTDEENFNNFIGNWHDFY